MSLTPLGWSGFRRRLAVVDAGLRALIAERRASAGEGGDILSLLLAACDERMRRRGITLQPGAGARVVLRSWTRPTPRASPSAPGAAGSTP